MGDGVGSISPATSTTIGDITAVTRLLTHGRENLLQYLVFTAWLKFMGIATYIPSVTVGG
jgi:hypothetical protein